jgi:outer membrane scaffolding protein for murein synthesis (MipA/OmpV family)
MFMRLVGDAADSPIVDDAGSPNQISGGLGAAYAW